MPNTLSILAAGVMLVWVGTGIATSWESADSPETIKHSAIQPASAFDPTSLVEVHQFSELPEDLKAVIRTGKVVQGNPIRANDPGGERVFLTGGYSVTSALVAFEWEGPHSNALAYARTDSKWVLAKEWTEDIGFPTTLYKLKFITQYVTNHPK